MVTHGDRVADFVRPALEGLGFKKERRSTPFTIVLSSEAIGVLTLMSATEHNRKGTVSIMPNVGVRHEEVARRIEGLLGEPRNAYLRTTVNRPLDEVTREFQPPWWLFDLAGDMTQPANEMIAAIESIGLPWMHRHTSLSDMIEEMERWPLPWRLKFDRPVALYLDGREDLALAALHEELGKLGDRTDLAAEEFHRFTASFERYIGDHRLT